MTNTSWQVRGDYCETCSCDFVCPCVPSNFTAAPTRGHCDVGFVFHIDQGHFGDVSLDGLNFVVVTHTPGVMGNGDWTVGLIVDERASAEQADAITAIASGQAGGPMAALGPLIGTFAGVERKPIDFRKDGLSRSASVPGMVTEQLTGVPSPVAEGQPLYLENTGHPVNSQIALATAAEGHIHAFGIDWDESSSKTNAHFAPFDWRS
jgi:hypothetical protein